MRTKAAAFILIGVVLILGLFYVLKPKNAVEQPVNENNGKVELQNKKFNLVIEKGKIVSGDSVLKAKEGDTLTISVLSDTSDEVHFHGYDKMLSLEKNVIGEITFVANLTGRFEFELEESGIELGVIEVQPK